MTQSVNKKRKRKMKLRNFVAKNNFNRPAVHRDRKNDYSRKPKHSKREE